MKLNSGFLWSSGFWVWTGATPQLGSLDVCCILHLSLLLTQVGCFSLGCFLLLVSTFPCWKGLFWSITGTWVKSKEVQGRCDGLWWASIWQDWENPWRQASGRSYVRGVKEVRLIEVGRRSLNVGSPFHGLGSQTTWKRGSKKSIVVRHFLLPDCVCDMTSCFMPPLPPMPCHDELPLELWTKITPSFLKLRLSGVFSQQLDQ